MCLGSLCPDVEIFLCFFEIEILFWFEYLSDMLGLPEPAETLAFLKSDLSRIDSALAAGSSERQFRTE